MTTTGSSSAFRRAEPRGFTKLVKRLFGERRTWPIEVRFADDGVKYRMNARIAEWWRAA